MARILIAEDVRFIAKVLASFFEDRGHVVEVAADGQQALDMARAGLPELILSDISMPKVDGLEVARQLKADPATAVIPIFMITARTDKGAMDEANAAGVDEYMLKPFDRKRMLKRATDLLGGFPMNYGLVHHGAVAVLTTLTPEFAKESVGHLREAMEAARKATAGPILLDLARVQRVETSCADVAVLAVKEGALKGTPLAVVEPAQGTGVRALRDRLNEHVVWHPDVATALRAMGVPENAEVRQVRLGVPALGNVMSMKR